MPEKDFIIWLNEETFIKVDFVTIDGRMVAFLVALMWDCAGQRFNVARYDLAHGVPHRDENSRRGRLLAKTWFPSDKPEVVLEHAIKDFKKNYESYIERLTRD